MRKIWQFSLISVATLLGILILLLFVLYNLNFNQFKGLIETRVSEITGRQLIIDGNLQFELSLQPLFRVEKVSLANAAWSKQKQMLSLDRLQLQVELMPLLDGQLVIKQLLLEGVNLVAEKNANGQANWVLEGLKSNAPEADSTELASETKAFELPFLPVLKQVQFDSIKLNYSDVVADIETSIKLDHLALSTRAANKPISFKAAGTVNHLPFNFTGNTHFQTRGDDREISTNIINQNMSVQFNANALGITLAINGNVEQPVSAKGINIELALDAPDLSKTIFLTTGKSLEQVLAIKTQPLALHFSTQLTDSDDGFDLNSIKLKLADSDLNGRLSLINRKNRPEIQADLHSERININQLLPEQSAQEKLKTTETKMAKPGHTKTVIKLPDSALPFNYLQMIDAKINYSAEQVLAGNFSPEKVKLNASLDNGLLIVEQFDLKLYDAPVRTKLRVNSRVNTAEINLTVDIDQLNLGKIASQLKIKQLQKGHLQSSINLAAKGNNIKSVLLSLKGNSKIQLKNVQFKQLINNKPRKITVSRFDLGFTSMTAPVQYSLTGKIDNEAVTLSGKFATASSLLTNKPVKLSLKASTLGTKLTVDGKISKPLNADTAEMNINITMPAPGKSLARLALLMPELKTGENIPELPLKLSGQLKVSPDIYSINKLQLTAGKNDLSGNITAKTHGSIPVINAKLSSKLLDINSLLPPGSGQSNESLPVEQKTGDTNNNIVETTNNRLFSADPLPSLDALDKLNASVFYKLDKLTANGQNIENISLNLSLKNSQLQLKPLTMDFARGTIQTNLNLTGGKTPQLQINMDINQLSYDRLLAMLGTEEYAKGELDAEIKLQGKGNSVSALMAGLNGKVRITTEDGLLNSKALQRLSTNLASLIPFTDKSKQQKIRCAVVQFNINNGLAQTHALVIDSGVVSALGTGDINLANESLALYISPRSKRTSIMELALVPVNIEGTLASPSVIPDATGATISTTRTAANIGLAVATGGISLAAEGLTDKFWEQFIDDTDYCALALAGEKIVPTLIKLEKKQEDSDTKKEEYDDIDEFDDDY